MASASPQPALKCPECQAPISPRDTLCAACGANIALYVLLAEREWQELAAGAREASPPTSLEQLVPRLGDYLVRNGHVTEAQLQAALERQTQGGAGRPRLGQTLVEMGVLTPEALDRVVAQQIVEYQAALLDANHTLERRVAARTAELETALAKLAEFNQLKANFVANISHELRTPLAKIKGYSALLSDGSLGPLTQEQQDALRVSLQAGEQLEQLINDLISYAQTARGELALSLRPVSVPMLILQVVDKSAGRATRKNISLTTDFPPGLPPAWADEAKLIWVLMQLVDNAIKFTPADGQVDLSAALAGGRIWVAVADNGIGIPPQRVQEIFEPFQQLDGSATRRHGGTGLGLTLARRIVEAHGGELRVESQEGRGSRFVFALSLPPPA